MIDKTITQTVNDYINEKMRILIQSKEVQRVIEDIIL